ncbi:MAG: GatB/YqeY domain-containing protein [Patescibacteria group bacterium]
MSLMHKIEEDFKNAMKSKDSATLSTLRMLKSALKNKQIELIKELSEEDIIKVIKSQIKQNKDSLESFQSAGRAQQVASLEQELTVLAQYLPQEMGDQELEQVVKQAVEQSGAQSASDIGKAMGASMKAVAGRADGARVKKIIETLIGVFVCLFLLIPVAYARIEQPGVLFEGGDYFIILARIFRVILIVFGIVSINLILAGGFYYMTASNVDKAHLKGLRNIATGLLSSFVVVVLFAVTTYVIQISSS